MSYSLEDSDLDDREDTLSVNYVIATSDCDCDMDLLLILDIFNENGDMIGTFEEYFTLSANGDIDISFHWENNLSLIHI